LSSSDKGLNYLKIVELNAKFSFHLGEGGGGEREGGRDAHSVL
jgi:hypothetical protein